MTVQPRNNSPEPLDHRYVTSLQSLEGSLRRIVSIVMPTDESGDIQTPTLYPVELHDDSGAVMEVTGVKISDFGHTDGEHKLTLVELTDTPDEGKDRKTLFGLLVESEYEDTPQAFMVTPIIASPQKLDKAPSYSEFKPASPNMLLQIEDGVIWSLADDLVLMMEPERLADRPEADLQRADALEALEESHITIPGVSYMGQLLVDPLAQGQV